MKVLEEKTSIEQYKEGDKKAFNNLYKTYIKRVFHFIYYKTLQRETAEDLTSQTFLKVLENMSSFDIRKGSFSNWLFCIARNTVIDHYRKKKASVYISDIWDMPAESDLAIDAENRIIFEKVKELIRKLPNHQREIIILRIWENLPYKEIAEILGKSEASCKMMFVRTIAALKKFLPATAGLIILISQLS